MPDPTNPTIISSMAFKPGGNWRYVYAVYEVRNQSALSANQIRCKLSHSSGQQFDADPGSYFETVTADTMNNIFVYRIHVRLSPSQHLSGNKESYSNPVDPGIVGAEDFTFSLELAVGTIVPPPSAVTQPVSVIEIEPCINIIGK